LIVLSLTLSFARLLIFSFGVERPLDVQLALAGPLMVLSAPSEVRECSSVALPLFPYLSGSLFPPRPSNERL